MTTIEYDLDLTRGLIEEIHRLVAPPQSEDRSKRQPVSERNHLRRPGKVPNHDCCDSCKEGGDLLCCDRCPAAFHLLCHDPPLDEEDVPPGEWLCHKCVINPTLEDDEISSNASSKGRPVDAPGPSKPTKIPQVPNKIIHAPDGILDFTDMTEEDQKNPLKLLAKASKILNPKQFELPTDLTCPFNFPGSSKSGPVKRKVGKDTNKFGGAKKMVIEMDKGLVTLPAKLCFVCCRSCRIAPLLQCDYCPLVYHLDCLNPPLTALPTCRWMCPNHVEHVLDDKLLTSVRLTDRVELWNKFTGPVDSHTIKLKFLKKIHRVNPPFRVKSKSMHLVPIEVPEQIKLMYRCPSVSPESIDSTLISSTALETESSNSETSATKEEQIQWLNGIVRLHEDFARYLTRLKSDDDSAAAAASAVISSASESTSASPASTISASSNSSATLTTSSVDSELFSKPFTLSVPPNKDSVNNFESPTNNIVRLGHDRCSVTKVNSLASSSLDSVNPLQGEHALNGDRMSNGSVNGVGGAEFHSAHQTGSSLVSLPSSVDSRITASPLVSESGSDSYPNPPHLSFRHGFLGSGSTQCLRALLCPVSNTSHRRPVPMTLRSLHIGSGVDMDVCLSDYGHCNNVSPKHACIFYDELSGQFELVNYSEHGTTVDNVLYSCDYSVKSLVKSPKSTKVSSNIRKFNQNLTHSPLKSTNSLLITDIDKFSFGSNSHNIRKSCRCKNDCSSLNRENGLGAGWDGTAILYNSSCIKIGCLEFIFTIVEQTKKETTTAE